MKTHDANTTAMNSPDFTEATAAAVKLRTFMVKHDVRSIYGMGDVLDLQHQLAEREREIADLIHPHDLAKYRSAK